MKEKENQKSDLSRLMEYAGGYKYFTYASWVLSAISAIAALVPFMYIWAIIRDIIAVAPNYSEAQSIGHFGIMAVVFALLSMIIYVGGLMCSHMAAFRVASNMRTAAMHHIVKLPLGFMDDFGSGRMRKIINDSSAATETYLAHQLPDKTVAVVTPLCLCIMLFVFDWRLGILSLIPVALAFGIMSTMTGKRMQVKMKEYQNALEDMSNEAVEYVRGIPVVKTFGQTVFSFRKFKGAIDRYSKWAIAYTKELRMPMVFYTVAINSVFAFLAAGAIALTTGGITPEFILNLMFYIIITPIITLTLTKMMYMSENEMIVRDALERIDGLLSLKPLSDSDKRANLKNTDIELKNVTHSYDGKRNALDNVSLKINSGETIALVGPSGGGKSTLANVISRFFDAQSGEIKIGGVNIRDIPKDELMNYISFVFQNSRLIKASIYDNVKLAKPTASRAEVIRALELAQCGDIIQKLPNGADTVIGTDGIYLSGGEQQRIAVARVILKNAPIVILDEATAFADPDNEVKVQTAFSKLAEGKTVIMIAHRLSTVVNADKIFILADGKINESGTFTELIEKNGMFAKMWNDYQESFNWKVGA